MFYLGTHKPHWLGLTDVPLFVSARRLREYRTLPRAKGRWALDSGGFTELSLFGRWETHPMTYATEARIWMRGVGNMDFAAVQDWMCEPVMLEKTRLTVREHQRQTVESYRLLSRLSPDVPWLPVLQGWRIADYLDHVRQYREAGIDLAALPRVGIGSVCRRQATGEAEEVIRELAGMGIRLHGFGFKLQGLRRVGHLLASSDSMAWSLDARRTSPIPGHAHKSCANCLEYALRWRLKAVEASNQPRPLGQPLLFGGEA